MAERDCDRGLVPVVGKSLELGLLVLYVSLLSVSLYAGVVPEYRAAAADEVGDRTLAHASQSVEASVPPPATAVEREVRVELPGTLRGESYRMVANGSALVLNHPDGRLTARTRLSLPDRVVDVDGVWYSGGRTVVVVRGDRAGVRLTLDTRRP